MIIWGSKARKSEVQRGQFFCPTCADDRQYALMKWQKYFTLYFIPLFPTETLAQHVECGGCRSEFNPRVLEHSREQIIAAISPWPCPACRNVNTADRGDCLGCGHRRGEPVAEQIA